MLAELHYRDHRVRARLGRDHDLNDPQCFNCNFFFGMLMSI